MTPRHPFHNFARLPASRVASVLVGIADDLLVSVAVPSLLFLQLSTTLQDQAHNAAISIDRPPFDTSDTVQTKPIVLIDPEPLLMAFLLLHALTGHLWPVLITVYSIAARYKSILR